MTHPVIDISVSINVPDIFPVGFFGEEWIGFKKSRVVTLASGHYLGGLLEHFHGAGSFLSISFLVGKLSQFANFLGCCHLNGRL